MPASEAPLGSSDEPIECDNKVWGATLLPTPAGSTPFARLGDDALKQRRRQRSYSHAVTAMFLTARPWRLVLCRTPALSRGSTRSQLSVCSPTQAAAVDSGPAQPKKPASEIIHYDRDFLLQFSAVRRSLSS